MGCENFYRSCSVLLEEESLFTFSSSLVFLIHVSIKCVKHLQFFNERRREHRLFSVEVRTAASSTRTCTCFGGQGQGGPQPGKEGAGQAEASAAAPGEPHQRSCRRPCPSCTGSGAEAQPQAAGPAEKPWPGEEEARAQRTAMRRELLASRLRRRGRGAAARDTGVKVRAKPRETALPDSVAFSEFAASRHDVAAAIRTGAHKLLPGLLAGIEMDADLGRGSTPLHFCAFYGAETAARMVLVRSGHDWYHLLQVVNQDGLLPSDVAARFQPEASATKLFHYWHEQAEEMAEIRQQSDEVVVKWETLAFAGSVVVSLFAFWLLHSHMQVLASGSVLALYLACNGSVGYAHSVLAGMFVGLAVSTVHFVPSLWEALPTGLIGIFQLVCSCFAPSLWMRSTLAASGAMIVLDSNAYRYYAIVPDWAVLELVLRFAGFSSRDTVPCQLLYYTGYMTSGWVQLPLCLAAVVNLLRRAHERQLLQPLCRALAPLGPVLESVYKAAECAVAAHTERTERHDGPPHQDKGDGGGETAGSPEGQVSSEPVSGALPDLVDEAELKRLEKEKADLEKAQKAALESLRQAEEAERRRAERVREQERLLEATREAARARLNAALLASEELSRNASIDRLRAAVSQVARVDFSASDPDLALLAEVRVRLARLEEAKAAEIKAELLARHAEQEERERQERERRTQEEAEARRRKAEERLRRQEEERRQREEERRKREEEAAQREEERRAKQEQEKRQREEEKAKAAAKRREEKEERARRLEAEKAERQRLDADRQQVEVKRREEELAQQQAQQRQAEADQRERQWTTTQRILQARREEDEARRRREVESIGQKIEAKREEERRRRLDHERAARQAVAADAVWAQQAQQDSLRRSMDSQRAERQRAEQHKAQQAQLLEDEELQWSTDVFQFGRADAAEDTREEVASWEVTTPASPGVRRSRLEEWLRPKASQKEPGEERPAGLTNPGAAPVRPQFPAMVARGQVPQEESGAHPCAVPATPKEDVQLQAPCRKDKGDVALLPGQQASVQPRSDGLVEAEAHRASKDYVALPGSGYLGVQADDWLLVQYWQGADEKEPGGWCYGQVLGDAARCGWFPQRILAVE